jgi:hypothetical protein
MGRHSVPRGEKSTAGGSNGSPRQNENHKARHRAPETTTPDTRAAGQQRDSRLRVPRWLGGSGR